MKHKINNHFINAAPFGYGIFKYLNDDAFKLINSNIKFSKALGLSEHDKGLTLNKHTSQNLFQSLCLDAMQHLIESHLANFNTVKFDYHLNLQFQTINETAFIFVLLLADPEQIDTSHPDVEVIAHTNNEMFFVSNQHGEILFSNKTARDILGYTSTELNAMHFYDLFPKHLQKEAMQTCIQNAQPEIKVCSLPILKKNGKLLAIDTHIWLGHWDGNEYVFSLTKNLFAESEISLKLRKIFNLTPIPMAIVSIEDGLISQINSAFMDVFGFVEAEVVGQSINTLHIFEEATTFKHIKHELHKKESLSNFTLFLRNKNQALVPSSLTAEPIDLQNKKFVMTFLLDLANDTHQKEKHTNDNRLQDLLLELAGRYINIPLSDMDREINASLKLIGQFVKVDRVYVFRYDFEAQTTTNTHEWCRDLVSPQIDSLQNVPIKNIPNWVGTHIQGKSLIIKDVLALDPKTETIRQSLESQGIKSLVTIPMMYEGACIGFVGFDSVFNLRSYTENEINLLKFYAQILVNLHLRKNHEKQLLKAKTDAIKANQDKNLFIAKISHEMRNPLNGAWGFIDLLNQNVQDGKAKEYVKHTMESLKDAIQISNDLLDIARIESNRFVFKYEAVNVHHLLSETLKQHTPALSEHQIRVEKDIDKLMYQVMSDEGRLKQILNNLLMNAINHAQAQTITLGCKVENENNYFVQLLFYVQDDGVGIHQAEQIKIFNNFYQGNGETLGSGLGLTITKELIARMGGQLHLKTNPQQGSRFYFSLILEKAITNLTKKKPIKQNQPLEGLKVIVAEDNTINQLLLKEIFKSLDVFVTVVFNGKELLQALKHQTYDFVFLDIHMPVLDGVETAKAIRNSHPTLPIVAITAAVLPHEIELYKTLNIDSIIEKPIHVDKLIQTMKDIIKTNTAHDAPE